MNTIFTLIVAHNTGTVTLIAQRGDYSHLDSLVYDPVQLIQALDNASRQLDTLQSNPPQFTVSPEPEPVKAPDKPKTVLPKKKKVSFNDLPLFADDPAPTRRTFSPVNSPLTVGACVELPADACDVDGDPIGFSPARIVEIQDSRVWLESLDGEHDVWIARQHLA
jgi:hypothetical protein